ncbi:MAG TPA: tetratricopeptide repeat protein, partial [Bryobacteraceae bacterium]
MFAVVLTLLVAATQASPPPEAQELLRDGLVALQHRDLPTAQQDLQQAAVLAPQNPYVLAALAQVYWKQGNRQKALEKADQATQYRGDNPSIAHGLAMFYAEAQEFKKAASLE